MVAANRYHSLSIQEKQAEALARVRERPVACPICGMQLMRADLLAHIGMRCTGPSEPGPGAKWITWGEAVALGVKELGGTRAAMQMRLSRWSRPDSDGRIRVRARGGRGDRKYLEGDLQWWLAIQLVIVVGTNKLVSEGP